jgi:O-antigen/teichoic acid export membrane protein
MFSVPSAFGLWVLAKPIIAVLTTSEFVETGQSITPIVAFSIIFYGFGEIFALMLLLYKKSVLYSIVGGLAAVINFGLNIVLIPIYGILGAAISTLIAYIFYFIFMYYQTTKYLKINLMMFFIIKVLIASIVMWFFILILNPIGIIGIIFSIFIGGGIYFSIIFLLKGFRKNELKIITEIIGISSFINKYL